MHPQDGRVVSNFIVQALKGDDITVYGDGKQTRSFQFVDDLVEGIYRLLMSDYTQPVNIGNPHEITMTQFAEEVIKMVGNPKATLTHHPLPTDDPKKRRPDITRAKEVLGWEPKVSRNEGMLKTYEYFKTVVKVDK